MDVVVFTPVLRLEPETVSALMALEHEGPLTLVLQRDNPTGIGVTDHLHQYQRGRELFLRGDYDAMLVIESDIVPPADTLHRLIALDADLAYGCYLFRAGGVVNVLEKYHAGARNPGESLTGRGLWRQAVEMGIVECSGSGLGCVLIRRHVIESVPFEASPGGAFFDADWTRSAYQAGFSMYADTAIRCEHRRDGSVLSLEMHA